MYYCSSELQRDTINLLLVIKFLMKYEMLPQHFFKNNFPPGTPTCTNITLFREIFMLSSMLRKTRTYPNGVPSLWIECVPQVCLCRALHCVCCFLCCQFPVNMLVENKVSLNLLHEYSKNGGPYCGTIYSSE